MKSLDELTVLAVQMCSATHLSVDIYRRSGLLQMKATSSRNSNKHVRRITYEKGKVIVREFIATDKPNKIISWEVETAKKQASAAKKPIEKEETSKDKPE